MKQSVWTPKSYIVKFKWSFDTYSNLQRFLNFSAGDTFLLFCFKKQNLKLCLCMHAFRWFRKWLVIFPCCSYTWRLHFCTYNFYMLSALPKVYPNNLQGRNRFFYNRIYIKCGPQDLKVYMPLSVIVPKSDVIFLAYIWYHV